MTEQLVTPPPYMWDRIEKILDEQDLAKKHTEKLITDTFYQFAQKRRNRFLFAALTSISLVSFILWNSQRDLKKQFI